MVFGCDNFTNLSLTVGKRVWMMNNLILFLNAFLSYAFAFIVVIALILAACFIGISLRKKKNASEGIEKEEKEVSAS